jgi:hypothetical protein
MSAGHNRGGLLLQLPHQVLRASAKFLSSTRVQMMVFVAAYIYRKLSHAPGGDLCARKLSASRAGMRSESLVFASLFSCRVQQVNAKLESCDG